MTARAAVSVASSCSSACLVRGVARRSVRDFRLSSSAGGGAGGGRGRGAYYRAKYGRGGSGAGGDHGEAVKPSQASPSHTAKLDWENLRSKLRSLEGNSYGAYKSLRMFTQSVTAARS